jgi:hypothetical protein
MTLCCKLDKDCSICVIHQNPSVSCQRITRHRSTPPAVMRIKKTKEAARTREKQKSAAQNEIDPTDPEYAPPSDEDIVAPGPSTSKSTTKKPEEARI